MYRDRRFQTYVTPTLEAWIRDLARERQVSASIIICDCVHAAWQRHTDAHDNPGGTSPERQRIFFTVALDALLMSHEDETLRDRTVAAYHRRLEKLGLIPARSREADDEA